jgi:hypothetical protein
LLGEGEGGEEAGGAEAEHTTVDVHPGTGTAVLTHAAWRHRRARVAMRVVRAQSCTCRHTPRAGMRL